MASSEAFTAIALNLPGTSSAPHFDRIAFKVKLTFATLSADGKSANIKFTPDEQAFKCLLAPEIYSALNNGWGRQGWTMLDIAAASEADIEAALIAAHAHAVPKTSKIR